MLKQACDGGLVRTLFVGGGSFHWWRAWPIRLPLLCSMFIYAAGSADASKGTPLLLEGSLVEYHNRVQIKFRRADSVGMAGWVWRLLPVRCVGVESILSQVKDFE